MRYNITQSDWSKRNEVEINCLNKQNNLRKNNKIKAIYFEEIHVRLVRSEQKSPRKHINDEQDQQRNGLGPFEGHIRLTFGIIVDWWAILNRKFEKNYRKNDNYWKCCGIMEHIIEIMQIWSKTNYTCMSQKLFKCPFVNLKIHIQ